MKKSFLTVGAAVALLASAVYAGYATSGSRPEYVRLAELSTNNLLQYTYGVGKCMANQEANGNWGMECSYDHGASVVSYFVYPPEKAPHAVVGKFYLEAKNQLAVDSAEKGLVRFLDIGTGNVTGA